eukprot:15167403-Heterocapsa_arctica.AAC.1
MVIAAAGGGYHPPRSPGTEQRRGQWRPPSASHCGKPRPCWDLPTAKRAAVARPGTITGYRTSCWEFHHQAKCNGQASLSAWLCGTFPPRRRAKPGICGPKEPCCWEQQRRRAPCQPSRNAAAATGTRGLKEP